MMNKEYEIETRRLLLKIGISSNTLGYYYILEATKILKKQRIHTNIISVYEMICKRLDGKSLSAVERCMRYALQTAYKKDNELSEVYSECPTPAAFLYDLAFNLDVFLKVI